MGVYSPGLTEFVYKHKVVSRIFQVNEADVFPIKPNEFFTENPIDFYKSLNKSLKLDLDLDFCMNLHKRWYNKINK